MKEEEQQDLSYLWHIAFTKFSGLPTVMDLNYC